MGTSTKSRWVKLENKDYQAKCTNGDFLIWRYGNSYKWRYRTYGKQYADQIGYAATLELAKKACESHEDFN